MQLFPTDSLRRRSSSARNRARHRRRRSPVTTPIRDEREVMVASNVVSKSAGWGVAIVATCLIVIPLEGRAAPSSANAPVLVLEAYTGVPPASAARPMATLNRELEARGFAARTESILRLAGQNIPRPGVADPNVTTRVVAQNVDAAYIQFTQGQYKEAAATLTTSIDVMLRNQALFAIDSSNNDVMFKGLATLSLCKGKLGDAAGAVATMKELIRMFPTRALPRGQYGPSDEAFYRAVSQQVSQMGRGNLTIAGGDSRAVLFVDGQIRGVGTVSLANLTPGIYHVFVQVPGTPGRAYDAPVFANGDSYVTAMYEIDSKLWVTADKVELRFANDSDREREARYASELLRRWSPDAGRIAVVGIKKHQERDALFGTLYTANGTELFTAVIALSEVTDVKLRMLSQFLADGESGEGLTILKGRSEPRLVDTPARERSSNVLPAAMTLAGGLSVVAGAVVVATSDGNEGETCCVHRRGPGITMIAGGALAGAFGLVSLRFEHRPARPYVLVGLGLAAIGTGGALLYLDEDNDPEGTRYINDTARVGVPLLIAGGIATTVGIVWWARKRGYAATPIATVARSSAFVGFSSSF
jgi:hypothetical protein